MRHGALRAQEADKLKEECGVFGACFREDAAVAVYYGLVSLQHRGQESAGIAVYDGSRIRVVKGAGLATEVFEGDAFKRLPGNTGIGHVRHGVCQDNDVSGAQPFVFRHGGGMMAVAHNGSLTNGRVLRERLGRLGVVFQSESDSEVIGSLIARYFSLGMVGAIERAMEELEGAYSFVVMVDDTIYAVRDPYGFRPLIAGSGPAGWAVSSESCALDAVGITEKRDVGRGEIVVISHDGMKRIATRASRRSCPSATCIFEYIYFARPDSIIEGIGVAAAREAFGAMLAREARFDADVVVAVPESGVTAALGYSDESGIPYRQGLTKNRYMGRTFIRNSQMERELGVRLKLNAVERSCAGKRVVLVDDSIVRGTTGARLVDLMRKAGATRVDMAVSSPPVKFPCTYGIDTASRRDLVAAVKSEDEIREMIGADALHYLSIDGMLEAIGGLASARDTGEPLEFCTACLDGRYPDAISCHGKCRPPKSLSYADSGVDIDEGERAVQLIKPAVKSTFTPGVIGDIGGFGGLFKPDFAGMKEPVLVSGTDGVGTKLKIAFAADRHDTIGIDAVAMCVNDVLVSGASPLFFLDYIGCGRLDAGQIAEIVGGVAEGCRQAGCALIGGETAEMPGFYPDGEYDIAGFAVGAVDRGRIIDGSKIRPGDRVIGLASSGLHSNGYSLARKALCEVGGFLLSDIPEGMDRPLGDEMLEPTRIYVRPVLALIERVEVLGMSHITGGGLVQNPPRILPHGASMALSVDTWRRPPIFDVISRTAGVAADEMFRVFNMGIGFLVVVRPDKAREAVNILVDQGEDARIIGEIIPGDGRVEFQGV